jgi:hypothetical protein
MAMFFEKLAAAAPAEDMCVILLEAPHARQPLESATVLVAVQHAKVGHADGQLPVAAQPVPKHQAVPCTPTHSDPLNSPLPIHCTL